MLEFVLPINRSLDDAGPLGIGHVELALIKGGRQIASRDLMTGGLVLTFESRDRWCLRCEDTADADSFEFVCLDSHGSLLMLKQGSIDDGFAA